MSWLRIREMVRKEFIQLFRDRKSRPILIISPLIQLLVFGYVVNYDIPALLGRDMQATDVFVMILRSFAPYVQVHALIDRMCAALAEAGIISVRQPPSRIFHYSTSPFTQILDGIFYVYSPEPVSRAELSFYAFLLRSGVEPAVIDAALERQIMRFATPGGIVEKHLFDHTHESSYAEALQKLRAAVD